MDEKEKTVGKTMTISPDLANRIQEELGENVYLCYQCVKCTSGCPVGRFFDWQPNQIMRALQLGQEDIALEAQTPWLCAACQTCTTRCPQELDIARIMDFLTREAIERGISPPIPEVNTFNEAFMREIRLWNRSYEPGLMAEMMIRNHDIKSTMNDLGMYMKFFQKGKIGFFPSPAKMPSKRKIKPIAGASKAVAYYPGCSLETTATEFNASSKSVCEALDVNLVELEGWVCCGSSAAHRTDPVAALRYPMENLAMIERSGFEEVTMPCAACFNRHKAAQFEIRTHEDEKVEVNAELNYEYQDTVHVSTLIEAIYNHVGTDQLSEVTKLPLNGLNVVCYYGCLLTRPPQVTEAEHPENPTNMDELMKAIGAKVHDWSYKTTCCGAAHSLTRPDIVIELSRDIIEHAREAGADVIAVACPLCHMNLDARQMQMGLEEPMPIMYFTQLMAIALGLPEKEAVLHKNLVDPRPLLREKGFIK
jgi:heterodisulfide reductase subunit B